MKNPLYIVLLVVGCVVIHKASAQENKSAKRQYAFIMVINKEITKLYYSPVFSFQVDKRGKPVCDLPEKEKIYRKKIADENYDVMTSDYFDTREEADQARTIFIESEKKAGRTVIEANPAVGDCI